VRDGRMVACGTVGELQAGSAVRLLVHAPSAAPGWASGLPGVTVLRHEDGHTELELAEGADDQVVLRAALESGPVHEFARRRQSLTDLFRHVVTEEVAA
jgi:ABC-2 type transport system ATP-binding protein